MFLTYTCCKRGGAGGNFAQGHQDIKICIPFLLSRGMGKFHPAWENWQVETVNLSFKVCMHRTRNKCRIILGHLLHYRRHMENIDTKTRHRKGDKVHMFGWAKGALVRPNSFVTSKWGSHTSSCIRRTLRVV